ncbi:MAG: hypothetical protein Q9181_004777 [Wetmoreana brouardii]
MSLALEVAACSDSLARPSISGAKPSHQPARSGRKSIRFALAFTALSIVAFTSSLDATILAIALPVVAEDLNLTSLESFWAGISFLLSSVLFQPVHTAFSDIFGRKLVLYTCILFFVVGSAVVGSARGAVSLITGRTLQGIGGGGMEALCEIILTDITTLKERPLYIGLLGLFWAFGSISAPSYERYPSEPAISPRLFSTATSSIAFLGSFIHGIIIWCLVYYLVLYFQGAIQHAPFRAAIDAFPLAFTLTPSAIVCALLIDNVRKYLWSVWLGWILCVVGIGTMTLLDHDSSKALYSGLQVAPGIGTGFLLSALAVPLQASMTVDDAGVAMGTLVFFRAVGSVVGVSLGSAIFTNDFERRLKRLSVPSTVSLPDASDAVFFLTQIKDLDLPPHVRTSILQLYAAPVRFIWITVACLAAVGLVSSFFMKELTLERDEMGRQAFEQYPESQSTISDIEK